MLIGPLEPSGHALSQVTGSALMGAVGRRSSRRNLGARPGVVAVVAHNGFWVASSSPAARVYVQLVGPLRPLHVHMDERVSFVGTVALNGPSFAERVGVSESGGKAELVAQGAHIAVPTTALSPAH